MFVRLSFLFAILSLPNNAVFGQELSASSLRGGSAVDGGYHQQRKLFSSGMVGFDWSNLFFHLGICPKKSVEYCQSQEATTYHLPHCGCPDCKLPHARHLPECQSTSSVSSYEQSGQDEGGSSTQSDSSGGAAQSPKRTLSLVVYIVGAAAVATVIGAMMMRKRQTETEQQAALYEDGMSPELGSAGNDDLSGRFGAAMAALGLGGLLAARSVPSSVEVPATDFVELDRVDSYHPGPIQPMSGYAI